MADEDGDEVSTLGWRQRGRNLRCNCLYLGVILWWLKREDALKHESAEVRLNQTNLWLREKAMREVSERMGTSVGTMAKAKA